MTFYPNKLWNVLNMSNEDKDKTNNSWHRVLSYDALLYLTFTKLLEKLFLY